MNSPTKLTRKPQLNQLNTKFSRLRCKSGQNDKICYISPKKSSRIFRLCEVVENVHDPKMMKLIKQNQQQKIHINELQIELTLLKDQLIKFKSIDKQQRLNQLYYQSQHEKHKKGLKTYEFSEEKNDISNFSFQKEQTTNKQHINNGKLQILSHELNEANKIINKLKLQLDSLNIDHQILQHRLRIKQKMIRQLSQKQCHQKFTELSAHKQVENFFSNTWSSKISSIMMQGNQKNINNPFEITDKMFYQEFQNNCQNNNSLMDIKNILKN